MPFFRDLFNATSQVDRTSSPIVLVLSEKDFEALEVLLAKVPYEHAEPIVRTFHQASAIQRNAGLLDVVEKVLELHRSAVAYRDQSSSEEAFH
ncbi:MAG: hypothetical protein JSR89_17870 [Proteobacteria bacterium]|nr:hypothetical protein [Pseudomonadota bacterium]